MANLSQSFAYNDSRWPLAWRGGGLFALGRLSWCFACGASMVERESNSRLQSANHQLRRAFDHSATKAYLQLLRSNFILPYHLHRMAPVPSRCSLSFQPGCASEKLLESHVQ